MLQDLQDRQLRPNRLVAILGGAMALIVCACGGVIIWVLSVSAASLDRTQVAGEQRLLRSIIDADQKTLSKNVADYAAWSELYEYLRGPRRPEWEADNLGPYIAKAFGIDQVFVIRRDGRIAYSFSRGSTAAHQPLSNADRATLAKLSRQAFRIEQAERQTAAAGIVELNGVPNMAAAVTVRTSSMKGTSRFSLIETRELNRAFLDKIGDDYGIARLRAEPERSRGLALFAPDNVSSGFNLVWQPSKTGRALFVRVLPAVVSISVAFTLAFLGLILVWWRIMDLVRSGEARILRAELEASHVRALSAEETSKSKSAFIANMSHELRTPLNAIIGFSEFIAKEVLGPIGVEKYREYAADIQASGHHLLGIVNDILQASKIDAGKFTPSLENVSVADAICESVRMVEILAENRAIRLNVPHGLQADEVVADRQAFHQILVNLLSNAVKFSSEGGCVDITSVSRGSECELCVTDHGCGIPPETLKDTGKPFVQAEGAYTRKYQGTGLGLAICFQLAEAMGGSIEIASTEGLGTAVKVRLQKAHARSRADATEYAA